MTWWNRLIDGVLIFGGLFGAVLFLGLIVIMILRPVVFVRDLVTKPEYRRRG